MAVIPSGSLMQASVPRALQLVLMPKTSHFVLMPKAPQPLAGG